MIPQFLQSCSQAFRLSATSLPVHVAIGAGLLLASTGNARDGWGGETFYSRQLDALKARADTEPLVREHIDQVMSEAAKVLELPLVERGETLAELEAPGERRLGGIDTRTWNVQKDDAEKAEIFALAMADTSATGIVIRELPLFASLYRLTGEQRFLDRVVEQLDEMSRWEPLQRPGWELYTAKNSLPEGGDGVWLATGQGLVAICQALDVLPPGALPAETEGRVQALLEREIARIARDWADERPWYVREQAVGSNQWVVPAAGLVVACVAAGKDQHAAAYELGIESLKKTVDALGPDGSVSEGIGYASYWTVPYYAIAAIAAKDAGDPRLAEAEFLKNFPLWYVQSFQPGENVINCFDAYGASRGKYHASTESLVRVDALLPTPYMTWLIREKFPWVKPSFYSLLAMGIPASAVEEPPLWGSYDRARWVVWRSSWAENASGVWVRGGHEEDGHAHHDRGHVNFIVHGQNLLIEAGTPGYNEVLKREKYDSVIGHNVLQIGADIYPEKVAAPISITRLDADGGDVTVRAGDGYPQVKKWERRVTWTADQMTVTDTIELKEAARVLLRWHLGSREPLDIRQDSIDKSIAMLPAGELRFAGYNGALPGNSTWVPPALDVVQTPAATITVSADQGITLSQEKNFDHVMKFREWKHEHTTAVVKSAELVDAITITSQFEVPKPEAKTAAME